MKKLMTLMLGLAFLTATVAVAQETKEEPKKETTKKKSSKKKSSKKDETKTPAPEEKK